LNDGQGTIANHGNVRRNSPFTFFKLCLKVIVFSYFELAWYSSGRTFTPLLYWHSGSRLRPLENFTYSEQLKIMPEITLVIIARRQGTYLLRRLALVKRHLDAS